jgi:hypothetical protein
LEEIMAATTHVCTRCSRISPADAVYCYYDGAVLEGYGTRGGGPVNIGAQPFPAPFVFPTGQKCLNFDQLALSCQKNWQAALDVLAQGYLEKFLGGMGRSDLAGAARDAARFPDRDRGLDQFLAKLPSDVVQPPLLGVEPTEVNLGVMKPGEDRAIDLRLENKGMRLIYGSVASDALWLAVGDKGNSNQKLFQFGDMLTIPVKIRGKHVQARNKLQQGKLTIETNAGKIDVFVKMDVPVKPYPDGIFATAKSPRQIAEKAKEKAKDAALLFESGAIAKWYRDNNWTYPVQGPAASGLGAVQQYFEALGLTPPPRVSINTRTVALRGDPGASLQHTIELKTEERRPIYAHGVSDQAWLTVKPAQITGRTATIALVANSIPNQPGTTLKANVTLRSNGNQRFVVPVTLEVGGANAGFDFPTGITSTPAGGGVSTGPLILADRPKPRRDFLIFVPAIALNIALLGVFAYDVLKPKNPEDPDGPGPWKENKGLDYDPQVRLGVSFNERQRFGFVNLDEKDPRDDQKFKRLTYMADGSYNNTCVKIDGSEHLYGQAPGGWAKDDKTGRRLNGVELIKGRKWVSACEYPGKVRVVQTVMIVPNEDTTPARLNTALIHYAVENRDSVPHKVGLRMMVDTYIGSNDGVPFALPGRSDLVMTKVDIADAKQVPEFIQALERPDLNDPGTVATMVLKFPGEFRLNNSKEPPLDPITRLVICRFPGNPEVRWDFEHFDMNDKKKGEQNDSCVTLYWPEEIMPAHTKRAMAFSYGLGRIDVGSSGNGGLALTAPAKPYTGGTFAVTAWVRNPQPGQQVTLELPTGMSLVDERSETQAVGRGSPELGQVSWRVKVARDTKPNTYTLKARTTGTSASVQVPVHANEGTMFGGIR